MHPEHRLRRNGLATIVAGALVVGSIVALWANAGRSSANSRDDVDLLDQLDPAKPIDEHTLWAIDAINGEPLTEAEVAGRLSSGFQVELPPAAFIASIDGLGIPRPVQFVGVIERLGDVRTTVRLHSADGRPFQMDTALSADPSRLDGLRVIDYQPASATHSPLELTIGLAAIIGLALTALAHRSRAVTWWLLVAAGLWLVQFAEVSGIAALYTASITLPWAAVGIGLAVTTLVVVEQPRGLVSALGPAVAGVLSLLVGAATITRIQTAALGLPRNLAASATTDPDAANRLADARASLAIATLLLAAVAVLGRRNRTDQPLVASAVTATIVLAATGIGWFAGTGRLDLSPSALVSLALMAGAAGHAYITVTDRLRLGGMAQLVVDLGDDPAGTSIEASLRRALDDPALELDIWPSDGAPPAAPAQPDDGRTITKLQADGRPLGLLIHDGQHRPEQVRAACSAVALAIRNAQLEAEVRRQLDEVRASRSRLLTATDDARRALERDLHDGAQQRILSAMVEIQRARRRFDDDAVGASAALDLASEQLEATLQEVRDIARGLRPGAMDRGLLPAVRELADRCPIPVSVHGGRSRCDPGVEHAAWFVISEALTNAARHADATSIDVSIEVDADGVTVSVADDGRGGAELVRGGGLEGIVDRVEALGGTVSVESAAGDGTTLSLHLPATEDVPA